MAQLRLRIRALAIRCIEPGETLSLLRAEAPKQRTLYNGIWTSVRLRKALTISLLHKPHVMTLFRNPYSHSGRSCI